MKLTNLRKMDWHWLRRQLSSLGSLSRVMAICGTLYVAGVFSVLLLAACAEAVVKPVATCRNTDWFEKGRADGILGFPANEIESHKRLCNSTPYPVDEDLYVNGRNVGLLEYCTPQVGVQRGKAALPYLNVCPSHLEGSFLNGYKVGGKIRNLEAQNNQVEKRMQALAAKLGKDLAEEIQAPASPSGPAGPAQPRAPAGGADSPGVRSDDRSSLTPNQVLELQELKKQHSQINGEIMDLESQQI